MSFFNSIKQILKPDDDFLQEVEKDDLFTPAKRFDSIRPVSNDEKVVNIRAATQHRVVILSPRVFKENIDSITEHLRNRNILVINLENTNTEDSYKLLYFVGGVIRALDGQLQMIATDTYLATPSSVLLEGEVEDLLDQLETIY
jgi:cell division inhibitor SepF